MDAAVRKGKEAVGRGQSTNQWKWETLNPGPETPNTAPQGSLARYDSPELLPPPQPTTVPSSGVSEPQTEPMRQDAPRQDALEAMVRELTEARKRDAEDRLKWVAMAKAAEAAREETAERVRASEERMAAVAAAQNARLEEALKQVRDPKDLPLETALVTTSEASASQVGSLEDFHTGHQKSKKKGSGQKVGGHPGDPDDDDDDEDDDDDDDVSRRSTRYSRVADDKRLPRPSDASPDKTGKFYGSVPFLRFDEKTDIPNMLMPTESERSTFPEAPEEGFPEDFMYENSVFNTEVKAMLKADKDDALGAHPYQRSFVTKENSALRLKAINQKGRGTTASARDIKLTTYLAKLSDPKGTKIVRAEVWIEMRGPFLMSVRRLILKGCPQQELLEVVHSMVVDKHHGNANICSTLELALKDSVMQGVPLMQWEVIFKRLDGLFLRGTTLDGTEAVVTWTNMTSRKSSQDLKILVAEIRQAQLDFKEVKYSPRTLNQKLEGLCLNNTTNLNEAFAKLRQMLINDEVNKGLGIYLDGIVAATVFEINGLIDEEPLSPKAIKMQKENVHWIYVHKLLGAEQMYLSQEASGARDTESGELTTRPRRTRVNAAVRANRSTVPQTAPVTYASGSESDGSAQAPPMPVLGPSRRESSRRAATGAPSIPRPATSAKHPYGNYGTTTVTRGDMQGKSVPSDQALRKIYVAAVRSNDASTAKKVIDIINGGSHPLTTASLGLEGPSAAACLAKNRHTIAAVLAPPVTTRPNPAGAPLQLPAPLDWKLKPSRWGRKCSPPSNGLGNPSGGEWTVPQWQDCCVNYDNLSEYQKDDYNGTGILARLATSRPADASRREPKLGRPATFGRDDTIPVDNCAYCYYTPIATGHEADEKHPQNWRHGTGNGAHPERTCQSHKRAVVELGNGRDQRVREHLVHVHANLVMARMPGSENRNANAPYPSRQVSS